jgi:hypothetical protein
VHSLGELRGLRRLLGGELRRAGYASRDVHAIVLATHGAGKYLEELDVLAKGRRSSRPKGRLTSR